MAILERSNSRSNLKPKIQVEEQMLECKAFNATSPKKQHSYNVEASDGIDQDATYVEDEGEEEENEHEEDQDDEEEKEVEEDNGEDCPHEEFGSKGNFTKSPLPKEKQPIKHKVVKTRLKITDIVTLNYGIYTRNCTTHLSKSFFNPRLRTMMGDGTFRYIPLSKCVAISITFKF
jgi:hypothetical protein